MTKLKCVNCNLLVNEVLCYIENRLDVMNEVSLAQICRQAFNEEEIHEAKCLLFEVLTQRLIKRKGVDRTKKNIEDIIGLLKSTDPDCLPIFVAREIQKLPVTSIDHIDCVRLLKDILVLQKQVRELQEKQDEFVTKKDMESHINISKKNNEGNLKTFSPEARHNDSYVNKKRGGFCVSEFYSDSGPVGLMAVNDNSSPSMILQNRDSVLQLSPSRINTVMTPTEQSVPVAPIHYAHADYPCAGGVVGIEMNSSAQLSTVNQNVRGSASPKVADAMTTCGEAVRERVNEPLNGSMLVKDKESEWVQVVKRKSSRSSRFKGMRGTAAVETTTKLRAADSQIPLYIYNVSNENTERDVADYIYEKTKITVQPERMIMKSKRDYLSFRFYIPKSKMDLFMDTNLWPDGIFFRRYILFRNVKKSSGDRDKNLIV